MMLVSTKSGAILVWSKAASARVGMLLLGGLNEARFGRVQLAGDEVGSFGDQRQGGFLRLRCVLHVFDVDDRDLGASLLRADAETAGLGRDVGNALQAIDAADLVRLAHASGQEPELAAELGVVPIDRHHVRRLSFIAAHRDELRLREVGRDLLHPRNEPARMPHHDLIALARVVAQRLCLVGVGDILGIGGLEAVRLEALQN